MRLSIRHHLKLISKAMGNFKKEPSHTIAQIHATILTILISVFSIASIYYLNILREKEIAVFKEASRINKLNFTVSCVFPSSEFPFPKSADDSVKLAQKITRLADCVGYKNSNPESVVIAKDIVDRGKMIFAVINVVTHRYPFPEYPVEKHNVFNKTTFLQFETVEEVRKWREDLQKVSQALFFPAQMLLYRPQIGDALINNDEYITVMKSIKLDENIWGSTDLHFIERDFYTKLNEAIEISNNVEHSLRSYDRYRKISYERYIFLAVFFIGIITFICGVIIPMVCPNPKTVFYIWIPSFVYLIILVYLIINIIIFLL